MACLKWIKWGCNIYFFISAKFFKFFLTRPIRFICVNFSVTELFCQLLYSWVCFLVLLPIIFSCIIKGIFLVRRRTVSILFRFSISTNLYIINNFVHNLMRPTNFANPLPKKFLFVNLAFYLVKENLSNLTLVEQIYCIRMFVHIHEKVSKMNLVC